MQKIFAFDTFTNKVFEEKLKELEAKINITINFINEKIEKFLNNFSKCIEDLNKDFKGEHQSLVK